MILQSPIPANIPADTAILAKLWLDGSWADGTDEQEDELDDVKKGILDAPTDNEGPGEIKEDNKGDVALETEDEDAPTPKPADPNADPLKDFPGFK